MNTFTPKTVEEFVDYYSNQLKTDLKVYDVQINKVGFLGFLLNLLGHTHYDLKNYYDFLFKESFIVTSDTDQNIHLHASTYGYFPSFAIPSKASGYLEIDFNILPSKQNSVVKRELYINNPGVLLKFESEGYSFCSNSSYKLVFENNQYKTIILSSDGKATQYPSSSSVLTPPLLDTYQYKEIEYIFKTNNYPVNSFYTYPFEISDGFISDIKVFVKRKNSINEEEFDVKYIKYFDSGSSKSVFLRKITTTKYILELGSGLRGEWLPQAEIRIVIKVTKGKSGNFLKLSQTTQNSPIQVILIDYDINNNVVSTTNLDSSKVVLIKIESSTDGIDPLSGEDLRDDVIKFIQTRDNLIGENDYINIMSKYLNDYKFLFKKIQVFDNVFHLYRIFRDKFQQNVFSLNHFLPESQFTNLFKPVFNIDGNDFISPFIYKYNSIMNWYDAYLIYDNLTVYSNSIKLSEDVPPTYNIPPLYFNLIYDNINSKTKIQIKSYQDISNIDFKISIPDLFIYDVNMININQNIFEIEYFENNGLILKSIQIEIKGYELGVNKFIIVADSVQQIFDITDLLNITRYNFNSINYLVGIPVIDKNKFEEDSEYYLHKIYDFILDNNLKSNRMISDNIQFRFLNNYILKSPFLEETVIQHKNIISLVKNWLIDAISILNTPIINPSHLDRFLIGNSPTDEFISHENEIAQWNELQEIIEVITNNASTLIGSEYFILNTPSNSYYIWYCIDLVSVDPSPFGLIGIKVDILSTDNDSQIADKTTSAINNTIDFIANFNNNIITIQNKESGNSTDSTDFNTGFNITVKQQGIDGHYTFELPILDDGIFISSEPCRYHFDGTNWNQIYIKFPLKLFVECKVDPIYITNNKINLSDETLNLNFQLADILQKNYSGTKIIYYNSQIIDFVHLNRNYIKSVTVKVTDYNGLILPVGIESKEDRKILENLTVNKFNIVKYNPTFWNWDIDNIEIKMLIDQ